MSQKESETIRILMEHWLYGKFTWSRDIDWLEAWWEGDPEVMAQYKKETRQ